MWTPDDGPKTPLSIFKNDRKEKESHPDFTGEVILTDTMIKQIGALRSDGKTAVLGFAGWHKKTKNNQNFISGSVRVDVYKTAKRYDVEKSVIEAIMEGGAPTPAAAPAAAASGGDDIFGDSPPAEDEGDDGLGL